MNKKNNFDAIYYQNLTEKLHHAQNGLTNTSTRISNKLIQKIIDYLKKCSPLSDAELSEMKQQLNHPLKMARVMPAVHLTSVGEADAWPTLLETAAPVFMPAEEDDEEGWKNYWATNSARLYLEGAHERLRKYNFLPSLEEKEDQWEAEPRPKIRITERRQEQRREA